MQPTLYTLSDSQISVLWGGVSIKPGSQELPRSSLCFRMSVPVGDPDVLAAAFNKVLETNDSLRLQLTRLDRKGNKELRKDYPHVYTYFFRRWLRGLRQYIVPYSQTAIPVIRLSDSESLDAFIEEFRTSHKPVLDQPLYTPVLISRASGELVLLVRFHHLIFDGYSFRLLFDRIAYCYEELMNQREPEPPVLSITHHFEVNEKYRLSQRFKRDFEYWKKAFLSQPRFSFPAGGWSSYSAFETLDHTLDSNLGRKLAELASAFGPGCSAYSLLLIATGLTVYRLTGKTNFALNHNTHGRVDAIERQTIGAMMNTLPVFFNFDPGSSIRDSIRGSVSIYMEALMHSRLSVNDMVRFYWLEAIRNFKADHIWMYVSSIEVEAASAASPFSADFYGDTALHEQFFLWINMLADDQVHLFLRYQVPRRSPKDAGLYLAAFLDTLDWIFKDPDRSLSSLRIKR